MAQLAHNFYTATHGLLTLFLACLVWAGKYSEWIGTAATSSFVILADTLSILNLTNALGIPKIAAIGKFSSVFWSFLVLSNLTLEQNTTSSNVPV